MAATPRGACACQLLAVLSVLLLPVFLFRFDHFPPPKTLLVFIPDRASVQSPPLCTWDCFHQGLVFNFFKLEHRLIAQHLGCHFKVEIAHQLADILLEKKFFQLLNILLKFL